MKRTRWSYRYIGGTRDKLYSEDLEMDHQNMMTLSKHMDSKFEDEMEEFFNDMKTQMYEISDSNTESLDN
jgi:hypothetical protein